MSLQENKLSLEQRKAAIQRSSIINYHMLQNKPTNLFTVEIKQYNIAKGFTDMLRGSAVILEEGWQSEYMKKLMDFLRDKVVQYNADMFEVELVPNMKDGLWMDDVTKDSLKCEVVNVKFHALKSKNHFDASTCISERMPADRPMRSAVVPVSYSLTIEPLDADDACEALRNAGFEYNVDTDCWFKPEKAGVNRAIRKHANFPFLYGRPAGEIESIAALTAESLDNLSKVADDLSQKFKDMYEQCPALFDKPLDSKSDGEEDA